MKREFLRVDECAEMLGVSNKFILHLIQTEVVGYFRVGASYRVLRSSIDSYLEETLHVTKYYTCTGISNILNIGRLAVTELVKESLPYIELPSYTRWYDSVRVKESDFNAWYSKERSKQQFYTPNEIASIFNIDLATVTKWIDDGVFTYYTIEGMKKIKVSDIEEFLLHRETKKKVYTYSEILQLLNVTPAELEQMIEEEGFPLIENNADRYIVDRFSKKYVLPMRELDRWLEKNMVNPVSFDNYADTESEEEINGSSKNEEEL